MTDTTTLIQRLRDMSAEHCGGSQYDRETSQTLDATIRTIEALEADAKRYHHELPQYRRRLIEMWKTTDNLVHLAHEVFYRLEDLWNDPTLVNDAEFRVIYEHIRQKVLET